MGSLDLTGMSLNDGIPGHVSADQGGIDVDHLARGDLGRHTGPGRAGQDGLEPREIQIAIDSERVREGLTWVHPRGPKLGYAGPFSWSAGM